jgi:uncharacterized protein YcgL (UPF0745 family)
VPQQLLVHNNDGLLDIPEALRPKYGKGRSIKMATLTKEEKIQAQVILAQDRQRKQQIAISRLEQQLEKEKQKALGRGAKEVDL